MPVAKYTIELEVSGLLAGFMRPDSAGSPTSFPVPTKSAAKGILEAIAYFSDGRATFNPTRVEVCRYIGKPGGFVNYQRYTTNYGGPLRKIDLFRKGNLSGGSSMQLFATLLHDVCYRIHADIQGEYRRDTNNACHHLQELFNRRLARGQCFRTPCLGWSEFTCNYWGHPRHGITEVDTDLYIDIPSMLLEVWDKPNGGNYAPRFEQDAQVKAGILHYTTHRTGTLDTYEEPAHA